MSYGKGNQGLNLQHTAANFFVAAAWGGEGSALVFFIQCPSARKAPLKKEAENLIFDTKVTTCNGH